MRTRKFWDNTARKYGEKGYTAVLLPSSKGVLNWYIDCLQKTALREELDRMGGKIVLDLGCGVGRWVFRLADKGAYPVGVDLSRVMIREAKRRASIRKTADADFVVASLHMLPFVDGTFDVCLSVTVLQHIIDKKTFENSTLEIVDALKDEGKVILLELDSIWGDTSATQFPTVNHSYIRAFVTNNHLSLAKITGVDISLFLKPLQSIAKRWGRYQDQILGEDLGLAYTMKSAIFYLLAGIACIMSLPLDLAFRGALLRFTDHKIMVFQNSVH